MLLTPPLPYENDEGVEGASSNNSGIQQINSSVEEYHNDTLQRRYVRRAIDLIVS